MGVSTDAILTFGVDFGSTEDPADWITAWPEKMDRYFDSGDPDTELAQDAGLGGYPDDPCNEKALNAWYNKKDQLLLKAPVEFVWHCSDNPTAWIVAIRGVTIRARRGFPLTIHPLVLSDKETFSGALKLREWIMERCPGLKVPSPRWMLCSYWG